MYFLLDAFQRGKINNLKCHFARENQLHLILSLAQPEQLLYLKVRDESTD